MPGPKKSLRLIVLAAVSIGIVALQLATAPASAQSTSAPPPGPVTPGTWGVNAHTLTCSFVLSGPSGEPAPQTNGIMFVAARCYGPVGPTTATLDASSTGVAFHRHVGPTTPTTLAGVSDSCAQTAGWRPEHGRYEFVCMAPETVPAIAIAKGPGTGYGAGYGDNYWAYFTLGRSDSYFTTSSNNDTTRWQSVGVWQEEMTTWPSWPAWYVSGATPIIPPQGEGVTPPKVTCTGSLTKNSDGTYEADVLAKIESHPYNDDHVVEHVSGWAFGWEGSEPGEGEPSSYLWWEDRPLHDGVTGGTNSGGINYVTNKLNNLEVPLAAQPAGGWYVAVKVSRTVLDGEHGVYPTYPTGEAPVKRADGSWWLPAGYKTEFVIGPNGLPVPYIAPTSVSGYSVPEDPGGGGFLPTSWTSIEATCAVTLSPKKQGGPGDVGGGLVAPAPPPGTPGGGGTPGEPEEPEEPEEACSTPEGWSMINPVAWLGSMSCVIGPILDLIGDILALIQDLFEQLLEWIENLLSPDWDGVTKLGAIKESAEERGPLAWGSAVGDLLGGTADGYSGDDLPEGDGPCLRVHPLQGPCTSAAPGGWWTAGRHLLEAILVGITALTVYRNLIHSMGADSE